VNLQVSVDIAAPPQRVWDVLIDVERWAEWTKSIDRIERLDAGAFGIGSRVRIHQPRIPVAIWTVTEFEPGRSFTWESRAFGMISVAAHMLEPRGEGVSAMLSFVQTGWLAWLVQSGAEAIATDYLALESRGLKRRCEA